MGKAAAGRGIQGWAYSSLRQLQIDFGERRMSIGDENVKVYLFVATLGYSRRLYVRASRNERQESWLAGVEGAFHHVGGITDEVLRYQLADARDCTASGRGS